jgi:CspA family cold shock protein
MIEGKVKWFDEKKGYGFIAREDGGDDVFLHYSELDQSGFKTIEEDTPVEFEVEMGPKGPKATDVSQL